MNAPRTTKDGAWCWLAKPALREIRKVFDQSGDVAYGLAVYVALSEISSNHRSETFQVPCSEIQQRSGVSRRKIDGVLRRLESAKLVGVTANFVSSGGKERLPNTYTLLQLPSSTLCDTPPAQQE